ncbi:MAG TPA: PEP-CTERM sorting domain-containing protein [Bryobacteraceae bacterium]|nr:PEP-CTERM sorting domain-containing protein [Bryobacteraceae bacterium]
MLAERSLLRLAPVLAFALVSAVPSRADVSYASYASWASAVTGGITSVTIPDPSPNADIFFGNGNASVTYSGVTFSTQAALSNGNFFNVGSLFSGDPAVLSSQQQTVGVANILITLPVAVTAFALNYGYGTFFGSNVTFALSDGSTITQGSTGSGYSVPDFFGVTSNTPFNSVLVTSSDFVLNLNNVVYGTASTAVPEPSAIILLVMMLGTVGLTFRLSRKRI